MALSKVHLHINHGFLYIIVVVIVSLLLACEAELLALRVNIPLARTNNKSSDRRLTRGVSMRTRHSQSFLLCLGMQAVNMREQLTASLEAWPAGIGVAATYPAAIRIKASTLMAYILSDDLRVVVRVGCRQSMP